MKGRILCVLAACVAACAEASMVEETLTLDEGWNAVYIEATPTNPSATAFFADLPVTKASCYVSSVYAATAQLAADGTVIAQKPVSHLVWDARESAHATLERVVGGFCYLIYATNAASRTFLGEPQLPRVSWQVSEEGFATIAPVSIPAGEEVPSTRYFGDGPAGVVASRPYDAWGTDPAAPTFTPVNVFSGKPKVKGGRAYAFESEKAGEWAGVIDVSTELGGALEFSDGRSRASVTVRNASAESREVAVSLADSARPGDVAPVLHLFIAPSADEPSRWEAFSSTNLLLAAGESRTLAFQCDKSGLAAGESRAAVLSVSDLGGTKMRVRIPVKAASDTFAEGEAPYPAGLWVGTAKLVQVAQADGTLAAAGTPLSATVLLHVDAHGKATLLQRVAVARETDSNGVAHVALYKELSDVPAGRAGRRLSCVFIDTANRAVAAGAKAGGGASAFGEEVSFSFTVGERAKENPFRHTWHPDHDGKRADYSGNAPSGDVPENFIGPVKPESFSVTNRMVFAWADDNGLSTYQRTPDETTFGRLDWTLSGLRSEPIAMRGIFALRRMCAASIIRQSGE